MKAGTPFVITPRLGEHLGFDRETPVKALEVAPEASPENTAHGCHVVMSSTGTAKPLSLILMVNRRPEQISESHYFLLDLDGSPRRAFKSVTKLDSSGKVVRGSGAATQLDVKDPAVQAILDREVAFWLKRYPKSPKKQPAPPKR